MASSVSRSRSKCHVAECRSKIKRDKTPSRQSSTPDAEDSGVQLDETPVFGCGFYEPETEIIALPQFETNRITFPEVIAEKDDDAMTVHASDLWCQAPRVPPTSPPTNCVKDGDQKSRGSSDPERSIDNNRKSRGSDVERKFRGSDAARNIQATSDEQKSNGSDGNRTSSLGPKEERQSHGSDKKLESGHALLSVPVQPRRTSGSGAVEFFTGSDPDSDGDESEGVSFLSAPETMPPKKPCRDTRNKMRFKKFFRPLRRSKSTGNTKESTSTFSFFHKHETDSEDRQSVDTGRGSMEPPSDRETEEQVKDVPNKEKKKKSITTEVREKLYVLRRRYTDLSLNPKDGKLEKPTLETIKNWSKTIELLLADKFGVQCFHAFLKSEFSEENIDFWIACESYKNLKPSKQPAQAQKIFAEFIAHQAPREINIDSVTRDATCARMVQPDGSTFDAAQKRIQALMDKDSYPRFIQSTLYQQLISGQSPLLS